MLLQAGTAAAASTGVARSRPYGGAVERQDVVAGLAVAGGGAVGAAARYGIGVVWPWHPPALPWATLGVNLVGCALIGVVLVLLTEAVVAPAWARPFVATGVIGGFTTFSAFAVETVRMVDAGRSGLAASYVVVSVVVGLLLVRAAAVTTRRLAVRVVAVRGDGMTEEGR